MHVHDCRFVARKDNVAGRTIWIMPPTTSHLRASDTRARATRASHPRAPSRALARHAPPRPGRRRETPARTHGIAPMPSRSHACSGLAVDVPAACDVDVPAACDTPQARSSRRKPAAPPQPSRAPAPPFSPSTIRTPNIRSGVPLSSQLADECGRKQPLADGPAEANGPIDDAVAVRLEQHGTDDNLVGGAKDGEAELAPVMQVDA
eukprot:4306702-Prymnesium_polylepis.1